MQIYIYKDREKDIQQIFLKFYTIELMKRCVDL